MLGTTPSRLSGPLYEQFRANFSANAVRVRACEGTRPARSNAAVRAQGWLEAAVGATAGSFQPGASLNQYTPFAYEAVWLLGR